MKDRIYSISGEKLEKTFTNLREDLGSIALRVNEQTYIYPTPSLIKACVKLKYVKNTPDTITLTLLPCVPDQSSLKELFTIINNYNFELKKEEESKPGFFII